MAMSQGLEHVEATLALVQSASGSLSVLGGVDADWKALAATRLASTVALLEATKGRFFLKTRLCLPFAKRCEDEAKRLVAVLAEMGAQAAPEALERLNGALEALEKAVKTLDERSLMQGMAIT